MRKRFFGWLNALEVANGNIFAFTAAEAAFKEGDEWLLQMLDYLSENVKTLDEFLKTKMPKVKAVLPEASYLAWLDFNAYGLTHEQLKEKLINVAKVALNDGVTFGGKDYEGCFRLNLGCPRAVLLDALARIANALNK